MLYEGCGLRALAAGAQASAPRARSTRASGVALILGAPDFANRRFVELYPDGLPPATPLVVGRESPPRP